MRTSMISLLLLPIACAEASPPITAPMAPASASSPALASATRGVVITENNAEAAAGVLGITAASYWTPDSGVIARLESQLRAGLEQERASLPGVAAEVGKVLDHLNEYRLQYIGIVTAEGTRLVLVNGAPREQCDAPDSSEHWQQVQSVEDGGFWYWRIQYDVTSERFLEFDSNGYA